MKKSISTDDSNENKIDVKRKGAKDLSNFSLSEVMSFFEYNAYQMNRTVPKIYLIFTFEPLHNFRQSISKLLKETVVISIGSEN